ncbi:MAG: ArsR/SmtB family transcription factor [Chloroflexia bacterium]
MNASPGLPDEVRQELDQLARTLQVLAEPRRLHILYLLMRREMCVCEILAEVGIAQPLVSHHLRVLSRAGLVRPRRQAQRVFYSVVSVALGRLKEAVLAHFDPQHLPPEAAYGFAATDGPPPEALPEVA